MSVTRILAFSSSRFGMGGYLETAAPVIKSFLGAPVQIAFVPFASVDNDDDAYAGMVRQGLADVPCDIKVVRRDNASELLAQSDAIMVGGGNTFKLLYEVSRLSLLQLIRKRVRTGTPYIGWSAGSNILCPTISTTNDMPIIQPPGFNALGLLPFQINPHYFNYKVTGQNGETRDQRLAEFVRLHPGLPVVGLPEGSFLQLQDFVLTYRGEAPGVIITGHPDNTQPDRKTVINGADLSWLMQ